MAGTASSVYNLQILFIFLLLHTAWGQDEPKFIHPSSKVDFISLDDVTKIGTPIYTLEATGNGDLEFSITTEGQLLAHANKTSDKTANVILDRSLDVTDKLNAPRFTCLVTDDKNRYARGSVYITINDTNNNPPVFSEANATLEILENELPFNNLLFALTASDDKDLDEYGTEGIVFELQEKYPIFISNYSVSSKEAIFRLYLEETFDYEKTSMYRVTVLAYDNKKNTPYLSASKTIIINVLDVDDEDPIFIKSPSTVTIDENSRPDTPVVQMIAVDGDRTVNDPIKYIISEGNWNNTFMINSTSGEVFISNSPDREALSEGEVGFLLIITAQEVNNNFQRTTNASCTVVIRDVNDEAPEFSHSIYIANITEHSTSQITLDGSDYIMVTDKDQSNNAKFTVHLTNYTDLFYVSSPKSISQGFPIIRVKNPDNLDYEIFGPGPLELELLAVDDNESLLNTTATVRVTVIDANDLYPQFTSQMFNASVLENATINEIVLTVKATDDDSGSFGTVGIRYSVIGDVPFKVDSLNGSIFVNKQLDRESNSKYTFTVTATDNEGSGNFNQTIVIIEVEDVNDNHPVFTSSSYKAILQEGENFQTLPLIEARDEDLDLNAKVTYDITSVTDSTGRDIELSERLFTLIETGEQSVELTVVTPLDYEKLCPNIFYNCTLRVKVEAKDSGTPSLNNFTYVEVILIDVNDEKPIFLEHNISKSLPETAEIGTLVAKVSATDIDVTDKYRQITYRLDQLDDGGISQFKINAKSGEVTVRKSNILDLGEKQNAYFTLTITAEDGIFRDAPDVCNIYVNITDVNNKPPEFEGSRYEGFVFENATQTEIVVTVAANDFDSSSNLAYSFAAIEALTPNKEKYSNDTYNRNLFAMDVNTGEVSVNSELDRETVEEVLLVVVVNDTNTEVGISSATVSLTILIGDINDNAPWFGQLSYEGTIMENSGTEIFPKVTAKDIDFNQKVTFSLSGNEDILNLVSISQDGSLKVKLNSTIDREENSEFNVTVIATDNGQPQELSNKTNYRVIVLDENDNPPVFLSNHYRESVMEDAANGSYVLRVEANDRDEGEFARIEYDVQFPKNQLVNFIVHFGTGDITVYGQLDRDSGKEEIEFTVIARDNPQINDPRKYLTATTQITITLLDVNDNDPEIKPHKECINVKEDEATPIDLMTIKGHDPDKGANGSINFYISDANTDVVKELFILEDGLDDKSATLKALKNLTGRVGEYSIEVNANDKGIPVRSSNKTEIFKVCVKDVNNHDPVIHSPYENEKFTKTDDLELNGEVFRVHATDDDFDEANHKLVYKVLSPDDVFKAKEDDSGIIILIKKFDRDIKKWYEVDLEVCDSEIPRPRCVRRKCRVIVASKDDKPPYFKTPRQDFSFTEELEAGLESNHIFNATDDDDDLNGLPQDLIDEHMPSDICYFIVDGNAESEFHLDIRSGILKTKKTLDYEVKHKYILYIKATNYCEKPPTDIDTQNADNTYLILTINVIDVNDHPPKFTQKIFGGGVDSLDKLGHDVLQLNATDEDVGENAVVVYSITSPLSIAEGENLEDEQTNDWFRLNSETGFIKLNYEFSEEKKGYISFEVKVTNIKELIDKTSNVTFDLATVKIYVLRDDQKSLFTVRKSKDEFWKVREEFIKKLSEITGYTAHINSVTPLPDRPEWCQVSVHYVDEETNEVIDPSIIENKLDADYIHSSVLANEFAVHEINKQPMTKSDDISPVRMSIYAVSGALVLCMAISLAIYCKRVGKLKLQLKASTISTYESSGMGRKESRVPDLPNTNLHTKPSSNPIYNIDEDFNEVKENDDTVSEGSLVDDANDFEGGENNGGFAGHLETIFNVENDSAGAVKSNNIDQTIEQINNAVNENFILKLDEQSDSVMI